MAEPSVQDLAYRTAASVFGGPVDLATMVMRPFGYKTPDEKVFGSSEYIGKKLEDVGLVSSARAPITEFLTSMAVPTPGGFAKGAALTAPQVLSMFVGARSLTWDASAAEKAKMLADIGTDARTIWQQTGTWKGPDGKWRQEISDDAAKITEDVFNQISENKQFKGPISQALQHEELYKSYPQAAGIPTAMYAEKTPRGSLLGGRSETFQIPQLTVAGPSTMQQRSVGLHELQHAIQQREGFARGGSPRDMPLILEEMAARKRQEARRLFDLSSRNDPLDPSAIVKPGARARGLAAERQAIDYESMRNQLEVGGQLSAYRRLAGEAEARATQARRNMTPAQRRAAFPEESYDVPINQLIVR